VLRPVEAEVDSDVTPLLVEDSPVESDVSRLAAVLRPVEADVESDETPLLVEERPVEREPTPL
jgi:hypothetical protein